MNLCYDCDFFSRKVFGSAHGHGKCFVDIDDGGVAWVHSSDGCDRWEFVRNYYEPGMDIGSARTDREKR